MNEGEMMEYNIGKKTLIVIFAVFLLAMAAFISYADPSGTTISSNTTSTAPTLPPASRNDSGGTITTMILNTIQQNAKWKAYIGNITGSLTLDDANNKTIFDWRKYFQMMNASARSTAGLK